MTSAESGLPPLAAFIAKEIRDGTYPLGSLLPSEQDLERTHGLSRYAVREATARLQDLGLIQKRRGVGTTVVALQPRREHLYRLSTAEDYVHYAKSTTFLIALRELHDAPDPVFQFPKNAHRWLKMQGLRHLTQSHEILSFDAAFIREDYSDIPALGRSLNTSLSRLVESSYDIKFERVEQDISADIANEQDASALGVEIGAPLLMVTRRFLCSGEPLIFVMGRHPAEKFRYKSVLDLLPMDTAD